MKKILLKCGIFIEKQPTLSFIWLKMINFARVILIMCVLCQTSNASKTRHYGKSKNQRSYNPTSQGHLIETGNGIKLTPLYEEMKLRAGVTDRIESIDVPQNDTVNVPVNDTVNLSQLTEKQRKIYEIIQNGTANDTVNGTVNDTINDTINAQTLSDALGASVTTIKRDIYVLRDLHLIKYVGSNKTGHWEVVNQ